MNQDTHKKMITKINIYKNRGEWCYAALTDAEDKA